jgi:hypothetical protein
MAINYNNKAAILFLIRTGLLPLEAKGQEKLWCETLDKCKLEAVDNDKFGTHEGAFSASIKEKPWVPNPKASPSDIWSVYWYFACIYMEEEEAKKSSRA